MNLGLFLSIGESLSDLESKGQLARLLNYNIKYYCQKFNKVYIFTYQDEDFKLPENCFLVSNKNKLHRYIYSLLLPVIHKEEIKQCDVLRGLQITGGIPCFVAKLFYKKPYIINYGYDYEKVAKIEKKYIQSYFFKIVKFVIIKSADAVIVTTTALKSDLRSLRNTNIYVIPNSVNVSLFSPTKKTKIRKQKRIIYIGRLEPQKNLFSLLESVKNLKLSILFIGDGSQRNKLQHYASKNKIKLTIIKSVSHDKLPNLLNSADVFIIPSLIEGHPKALLEAMSVGLPCIGSKVEGIRELINHNQNGVVTGTNSSSIRNGLLKLLGDKSLQKRLGQNARKFIINNFDSRPLLKKETNLLLKLTK